MWETCPILLVCPGLFVAYFFLLALGLFDNISFRSKTLIDLLRRRVSFDQFARPAKLIKMCSRINLIDLNRSVFVVDWPIR